MDSNAFRFRRWFAAVLLLALAGCGGGGGVSDVPAGRLFAPADELQGNWQRTVTFDGQATAATSVAGADVPSESEAAAFTTATVAQLEVLRFPGKTVTVSANTVTVTDPDPPVSNFTVQVNALVVTDYAGCRTCAVGSIVTFKITADLTESGLLDGAPPLPTPRSSVLLVRYQRVS